MAVGFLDLDLAAVLTAYLFVNHGKAEAGIFAFGQGFLIDIFSADPLGLYTLLYLAIFLGFQLGCSFFNLKSPRSLLMLVTLVVLVKEVLLIGLLKVFSLEIFISTSNILSAFASALVSGILAPLLFFLFDRIKLGLGRRKREAY